jgi:uncharacterized protein (TIGR02453 family)
MPSPFSPKTLSFLRSLKRNNDREWFRLHKDRYEAEVRRPMIALLERLAGDLRRFSPELICDPRVSLYRVYRDTRFSPDKTPLKTHIAARFPAKGLAKSEGAALYLHVAHDEVWIGGGVYMPTPQALRLIREHVAVHYEALGRLVRSARFRREVGSLTGEQLSGMPRGYGKDHPAAGFLRRTQFLAGREFEPSFATHDRFYPAVVSVFQAVAPLVRFLNTPLLDARRGGGPPRST